MATTQALSCACLPLALRLLSRQNSALVGALQLELHHPDVVDWLLSAPWDGSLRLTLEILRGARTCPNT